MQVIEHVEQLQQIKETPSSEATAGQDGFQGDTQGQPGSGAPLLEAVLGHGLRHPNVVQTYKYATHNAEVPLLTTPYQSLTTPGYCLILMRSCSEADGELKCMFDAIQL
jgi:hypothetical protein